ncbi:MAG TPA: ferritin-like domain-containing protein [Streptosporangiaceae bacterium]|nr:ferritin-like domain-containing protein [Streptosporangiaceae bacterium]
MNGTDPVAALQAALAAEHATVYGYGVAGARLRGDAQATAHLLWQSHRAKRDRLADLIIARRAEPVAAAPAYRLPIQVTSSRTAGLLAAAMEDRLAAAYLALVGVDEAKLRTLGAQSMQEAVIRACRWRAGPTRSAFPGLGGTALAPLPE